MRLTLVPSALLSLLCMASSAASATNSSSGADERASESMLPARNAVLGWVPLQGKDVDSSLLNAANGQLSSTLAALGTSGVVALDTPARNAVAEPERLQAAGRRAFVSHVVTGELVGDRAGVGGRVRVLVIPVDTASIATAEESFPVAAQGDVQAAVEAATCRGLSELTSRSCLGRIGVDALPANAALLVDGKTAQPLHLAGETSTFEAPVGARRVQLIRGDRSSTDRRVFVHVEGVTRLRLVEGCGQLYVTEPGEEVSCTEVLPLVIVSPDESRARTHWPAITTASVGAALLISGLAFGLHAHAIEQRLSSGYDAGGLPRDDVSRDLAGMRASALAANVQLATGGLALAAGGALLAWEW